MDKFFTSKPQISQSNLLDFKPQPMHQDQQAMQPSQPGQVSPIRCLFCLMDHGNDCFHSQNTEVATEGDTNVTSEQPNVSEHVFLCVMSAHVCFSCSMYHRHADLGPLVLPPRTALYIRAAHVPGSITICVLFGFCPVMTLGNVDVSTKTHQRSIPQRSTPRFKNLRFDRQHHNRKNSLLVNK